MVVKPFSAYRWKRLGEDVQAFLAQAVDLFTFFRYAALKTISEDPQEKHNQFPFARLLNPL